MPHYLTMRINIKLRKGKEKVVEVFDDPDLEEPDEQLEDWGSGRRS